MWTAAIKVILCEGMSALRKIDDASSTVNKTVGSIPV
jgi:hypothetical protein